MSTPMTIADIERRLRFAAPDEPAVLPALHLPRAAGRAARVSPSTRFLPAPMGRRHPGLSIAIAVLALVAAGGIIAGTLRLLREPTSPMNQLVWPPAEGVLGIQDGFTMSWPEDWHRLAEGGLEQGDFTQTGISYERVALILASVGLPGCPGTSATAGSGNAVPSGEPVPLRTPNPTVVCLRSAPLPPRAIRITVEVGERTSDLLGPDGPAVADTSEPTEAAGWTETIDGMPARLQVIAGPGDDGTGVAETRVWDVIFPATIDHLLRIRADIGAGDVGGGRAAARQVVDTIRFATQRPIIDAAGAAAALVRTVDMLDRTSREGYRSDFYDCFPREPGEVAATISASPWQRLGHPVAVTCSTSLEESRTGLWRITLTTRWAAGSDHPAGGMVQELFVAGPDPFRTGVNIVFLDAAGKVTPDGANNPPLSPDKPPAAGDLDGVAAGSIVELYQGTNLVEVPGGAPWMEGVYGQRAMVVGGPREVAGEDWYLVHWDDVWRTWTLWLPAAAWNGAVFHAVTPECPRGTVDFEGLSWLTSGERLACYATQELSFGPVVLKEAEPRMCLGDGSVSEIEPVTCPPPPPGSWLGVEPAYLLYGPQGPDGRVPGLGVWLHPSIGSAPLLGTQVRVVGHFDDPQASECAATPDDEARLGDLASAAAVLDCRVRFVITAVEAMP